MVLQQRRGFVSPWIVGVYLSLFAIVGAVSLLSELPLDLEGGPLSFVDAFLLFVLAGSLLVLSARVEWRTPIRSGYLLGTVLALGIGIIQLIGLLDGDVPLVEELDTGNMLCWLIAGGFLVWMLRAARPVRSAERFLILGFVLQSFSLFADVTDGMFIELPDLFDWLFGPGEEISEVLFLATYCCGFGLLASQSTAEALQWRHHGAQAAENEEPALIIKRIHMMARWRSRNLLQSGVMLMQILATPVRFFGQLGYHIVQCGARIRQASGKDRLQQGFEAIMVGITAGVPAANYYKFDLFKDRNRSLARHYLHRYEFKGPAGINKMIKRLGRADAPQSPLSDKAQFAAYCLQHDLPTIPVLAHGSRGTLLVAPPSQTLPASDLFIKPNKGKGGKGAERWRYAEGAYRHGNDRLNAAQLLQRVARSDADGGAILQPLHLNHPALIDLSGSALSTVRILTCLDERRRPEITHAVFRMAIARDAAVDNFHAGGIAAAIDLATGKLGEATDLGLKGSIGWTSRHPLNGAPIVGRVLPFWREAMALALQAHESCADRTVIGWDVAIVPNGVELVEGNAAPDLDILQRTHSGPIGLDRLGKLLAYHLQSVSPF